MKDEPRIALFILHPSSFLLCFFGLAAALLLAFHPMLLSGLARTPGDLGDARLVNYLLEHGWRWLLRQPLHRDFWSPPVFYPAANTAAYSDLLLSAGPFYWCWRAAGFPADTAFQLWLLTVSSLNYLTMYALLARLLRLRPLAAALGAVLFTAGNSRVAEIVHPQLYVHFYMVVAVYALARFFEASAGPPGEPPGLSRRDKPAGSPWFGAFCLACALQIYASFYLGWFLMLGLLAAAAIACSRAATRRPLFVALWKHGRAVLGWSAAAAALTAPLAWHYLLAAREVGVRDWWAVAYGLPSPAAWFLLDPTSWLYGGVAFLHAAPGEAGWEQLGVGFAVPLLAVWGLWRRRKEPIYYYLLTTAAILVVVVTTFGPVTAWIAVYLCVPGGAAVRAAYRLCLLVLFAVAVGAAAFVHERRRVAVAAALALFCVLEQGRTPPTFSKEESRRRVAAVAARAPAGRPFLYTPTGDPDSFLDQAFTQVDAMWAGAEADAPTLNGYSGNVPPHYPFSGVLVRDGADLADMGRRLKDWCEGRGLDPAAVTWIHD